jgi:hypothetical protein
MTATSSLPEEILAPSYDHIINIHDLRILKTSGDWSLENGDLAMTKDGDIKVGDTAYNGLFRLVQTWRYNVPHLRYLFETMNKMLARYERLNEKMNAFGAERSARFCIDTYGKPDTAFAEFATALNAVWEEQGVATFGAATYSGCLTLILSGALLRFKDDIAAKGDWNTTRPFFNTHSVGAIIVAAANGYRHSDEWAKTRRPTPHQQASQDIINGALSGRPMPDEQSPGRCVEVLQLLSGGNFESLASNVFAFAHNLALKVRARAGSETK